MTENELRLAKLAMWLDGNKKYSVTYYQEGTVAAVELYDTLTLHRVSCEVTCPDGNPLVALQKAIDKWEQGEFANSWNQSKGASK